MTLAGYRFAILLTEAVKEIKQQEKKAIGVIQDEIGQAIGRDGGSTIDYWRRGHIPRKKSDIEKLARYLLARTQFNRHWLEEFLEAAEYPFIESLCQELFASDPAGDPHLKLEELYREHAELVGREQEIAELIQVLSDQQAPWCVCLDGLGGVGKSALALHVARLCRDNRLFRPVVWLNAAADIQHSGGAFTLDNILNGVVYALQLKNVAALSPAAKMSRLRTVLREQRLLLILDHLDMAGTSQDDLLNQLGPLLNPGKALLISRRRFQGNGYALSLKGLEQTSALKLIQREALAKENTRVTQTSIGVLSEIVEATGGSPLALKLVTSQLSYLPQHLVLAQLEAITRATTRENRYTRLYQHMFSQSWQHLSEESQQLLLALAQFIPGLGGAFEALAYCSQLPPILLAHSLDELWQSSLVDIDESSSLDKPRYRLHPLTHNFVTSELAMLASGPKTHQKVQRQIRQNYVAYYTEVFAQDPAVADAALAREINNITQALNIAHQEGRPAQLIMGALRLSRYWQVRGQYREAIPHLQRAVDAARAQNDLLNLTRALCQLSSIQNRVGQLAEAEASAQESLALARRLEDEHLIALSLQLLGSFAGMWRGDHALAEKYSKEALVFAEAAQDYVLMCRLLTNLGNVASEQGDLQQAIDYWEEAIATAKKGAFPNESVLATFLNIGVIEMDRGHYHEAENYLSEGLRLARQLNASDSICRLTIQLGQAKRFLGHSELAEGYFQEGLKIARETGHLESMIHALQHLGDLAKEEGNYARALIYMNDALALAQEANVMWEMIAQLIYRGELFFAQGSMTLAEADVVEALALAEEAGLLPLIAIACRLRAKVAHAKRDLEGARTFAQRAWEIFDQGGFHLAQEVAEWMSENLGTENFGGECQDIV